jgi:hypothetical protein
VHRHGAGDERVDAFHGKVEDFLAARRPAVDDLQRERRQGHRFLVETVPFLRTHTSRVESSEPVPCPDLREQFHRRREAAGIAMQGLELPASHARQALEAIMPLEQRVVREDGRLEFQ